MTYRKTHSRDLTDAQFFAALKKYGIKHEPSPGCGNDWAHGSYDMGAGGTMPVRILGAPQIDVSSRRRLLSALILRKERAERAVREKMRIKDLPRGARIARWCGPSTQEHAIIVQPWFQGVGTTVSTDGRRHTWSLNNLCEPEGKWVGPRDLVEALSLERESLQQKVVTLDKEIEAARRELQGV